MQVGPTGGASHSHQAQAVAQPSAQQATKLAQEEEQVSAVVDSPAAAPVQPSANVGNNINLAV